MKDNGKFIIILAVILIVLGLSVATLVTVSRGKVLTEMEKQHKEQTKEIKDAIDTNGTKIINDVETLLEDNATSSDLTKAQNKILSKLEQMEKNTVLNSKLDQIISILNSKTCPSVDVSEILEAINELTEEPTPDVPVEPSIDEPE